MQTGHCEGTRGAFPGGVLQLSFPPGPAHAVLLGGMHLFVTKGSPGTRDAGWKQSRAWPYIPMSSGPGTRGRDPLFLPASTPHSLCHSPAGALSRRRPPRPFEWETAGRGRLSSGEHGREARPSWSAFPGNGALKWQGHSLELTLRDGLRQTQEPAGLLERRDGE